MTTLVPASVLAAYDLEGAAIEPITLGLVNRTFRVTRADGSRVVLQRMNPIFRGEVNLDLDAVTTELAARMLPTPRLVRTVDGRAWVDDDGVYRVITFLAGSVYEAVPSPEVAFEAGALAGRFHAAMSGFEHVFAFTRPGPHDTVRHLARLEEATKTADFPRLPPGLRECIAEVFEVGAPLSRSAALPTRIVHGDLKITNLLFDEAGTRGMALLDLDTLAHGTLESELGDALRSWANPLSESAPDAYCDLAIARAALEGFRRDAGEGVTVEELASVPRGMARISVELASRFALDAIEDRFFGWDAARYESRRHHNLARARSQLALCRDTLGKLDAFT